jgi:hypothetical protein
MGKGERINRDRIGRPRRMLTFAVGCAVVAGFAPSAASAGLSSGPANGCQPFSGDPCLFPFPNDLFTKHDSSSATGRRVHLPQDAMPTNTDDAQMSTAPYDVADGFSPGSSIIVRVPGLDNPAALDETGAAPLTDIGQSLHPGEPIALVDAKNSSRRPIWSEIDSNASTPENTNLLIHPAKNLKEGRRYIVVLRHLKDSNGDEIDAPGWFKKLRDGKPLPAAERSQRQRYDRIFGELKDAGIRRGSLYEAWDFTVESSQSLASRMLAIRNDAFSQLGDGDLADGQIAGDSPAFHVDTVENFTHAENSSIARRVTGTFTVPCYLDQSGCPPGATFHYDSSDPDATPTQMSGNEATAPFICIVPRRAANVPARPSLYGHGLLGAADEVNAGNVEAMAQEHGFVFCATNWWGLSEGDVVYDISALQDLNKFPAAVDRLQQGVLNTLYLGRLMIHPDGFSSDSAFDMNGHSVIDPSNLYYDGNSQGGIMGGMTTAVAPDFQRAVLGVPGMNYGGILLQRSVDFDAYKPFLYGKYPDESIHPLLLDLMQQIWDRGEANGYAAHMTHNPYPDTPSHQVLMHVAYGDHQVSMYAAMVEARTIHAYAHVPALDSSRLDQDSNLLFGIPDAPLTQFHGSGVVIWDSGAGLVEDPPVTNTPPSGAHDPHSDPRSTVAARTQKSKFLKQGAIVDVCGGGPCHTDAYTP